jgi:HAD superfamily hydrolase (TIGR01484 family)
MESSPKKPEKESSIKLISTDFDGTLFAEFENPPIPVVLQELLAHLQARGVKWVINTGRDMASLMESLGRAAVPIKPDYLVLVEREIHFHQDLQYLALEEWNTACTRTHAELFARIRGDLPRLVHWISARFQATLYEDAYSPLCLIAASNGDMNAIHNYLETYCGSVPGLSVVRNDVYARFSHVAYSKGSALAEITRRLGLDRSQVFAVGDHLNDLSMLSRQYAGYIAAPANAIPEVREAVQRAGGYLSLFSHGEGVADAIKFMLRTGLPDH